MKQKKGVSLIVSYVLLIVIIMSLAGFVYAYLKLFVPAKTQECSSDVSLAIERAKCTLGANPPSASELNITLRNNGLFSIQAIFIRIAPEGREIGTQVNKNKEALPFQMSPGNTLYEFKYALTDFSELSKCISPPCKYTLEIQPAVIKKGTPVVCSNIASQILECR